MEHWKSVPALRAYIEWETENWLKNYAKQVLSEFLSYIDEDMIRAIGTPKIPAISVEGENPPLTHVSNTPIVDAIGVSLTPESLVTPILGKPSVIEFINSQP
jgi:hypothetical protein